MAVDLKLTNLNVRVDPLPSRDRVFRHQGCRPRRSGHFLKLRIPLGAIIFLKNPVLRET
jgi:hypothetical protein